MLRNRWVLGIAGLVLVAACSASSAGGGGDGGTTGDSSSGVDAASVGADGGGVDAQQTADAEVDASGDGAQTADVSVDDALPPDDAQADAPGCQMPGATCQSGHACCSLDCDTLYHTCN